MTDVLPDLDDYQFFEPLGRGTLGVVYRARDLRTNGLVALKWCSADKCNLNDAALYAVYDPALFVPIVTAGVSDDFVYVVSEYQDAGSLAARLNDQGPYSAEDAAKLVRTLCRAVDQLHAAGIVHGRLKPTDVLFTEEQQPRLSDQMLVARQPDDTDPFRPPEPDQTTSGDIYRLGGILYAALTAQAPLRIGGSIHEEPLAPRKLASGVPHVLQDICLKCLARSPSARYSTVAQLAEDLDRFLTQRPLRGIEDADALSPWQWLARYPVLVAIPLAAIAFTSFPPTVAAGLTAATLGVFVTPVRGWSGPILGTISGAVLLLIELSGVRLISPPAPWMPPPAIGWAVPWLSQVVTAVRSPAAISIGYLILGGLTGWAWQSLRAADQRQRTWTAWPYLMVLIAFPWVVAFDHVVIGVDHKPLLFGVVGSFIAVLTLPLGMLLSPIGWWATARRTTLENARLTAILGLALAALAWRAIPVAWKIESSGGRRPMMAATLLPPIQTTFKTLPQRPAPVSDILTASIAHLAPLGLLAAGATVVLATAGTYPRTVTAVGVTIGMGAVATSIFRSLSRDPELLSFLPGDASAGYWFAALLLVIFLSMVTRHFSTAGAQRSPPTAVTPGFTGRVLIAACAIAVLIGLASLTLAGLSHL